MSIEVHIDWEGETKRVGLLRPAARGATVTFEYHPTWLSQPKAFAIDPTNLPLRAGPHHSPMLFGAIQDCGPDRWGRVLIERAVRRQVLDAKPYRDFDYVLALEDSTRIGALRFRDGAEGPFLAISSGRVPPVVQLAALLNATDAVHGETETAQDLRFLLGAGSPLGGARPKSVVALPDGQLAIAKFPKPDDTRDIAAGEVLALGLARSAGIRVPEHQLVQVRGRGVSVITRFDRIGTRRIPFLSAHSLLGLAPGEAGSYTQLADGIRQCGEAVREDLRELWRRLIFSLLASNDDDHLRNHGFLMHSAGHWSLSPAYDLNPVPEMDRSQTLKTPITERQEEPSVAIALDAAPRFGLRAAEARGILRDVVTVIRQWRQTARRLRLSAETISAYASAFENPSIDEAASLLEA
jgi:serine/threonine-protein kinase HipA